MRKYINQIISVIIVMVLAAAWFFGCTSQNAAEFTCILSVRCDKILENMNMLDKEKHELVPDDGVIFPETEVAFYEGESVFDVLQRTMKQNKIHFEFAQMPVYNSAYIKAINNLYEFDAGELSGWVYRVNGENQGYGVSQYTLKNGDAVELIYTLDLGNDIDGGEFIGSE